MPIDRDNQRRSDQPWIVGRLGRRAVLAALAAPALAGCGAARRGPTAAPTPSTIIGPDAAALRIGEDVRVRMRIECTYAGLAGRPIELRPSCFYEGYYFRLIIPPSREQLFIDAVRGAPAELLADKVVDAIGVVQKNGIWSEIVLESPSQLKIATGWAARVPTPLPTVDPPPGR